MIRPSPTMSPKALSTKEQHTVPDLSLAGVEEQLRVPKKSHTALLVCVLMSALLFSGIIFGWTDLELWLVETQQYTELCGHHEPAGRQCGAQASRLDLIFAVAAFGLSGVSLPVGIFLDRFGAKWFAICSGTFVCTGCFLFAFADSLKFDVFIPAYFCLAVGGVFTLLSSFTVSFLFPEHQATILSALSCLFDTSTLIFPVFYEAHELFHWSREGVFVGYACCAAAFYATLFYLWGRVDPLESGAETDEKCCEMEDSKPLLQGPPPPTGRDLMALGLWEQARTYEFVCLAAFASIHMLRANIYIMMNNQLLEQYNDADHDHLYTKIFSFVLPAAPFFFPVIDRTMSNFGLLWVLQVTNGLGLLYGGLALVPSLPVQVITFLSFVCFRVFLYSATGIFIAQVFGLATLGRLSGITYSISAIVGLLQYPASALTNDVLDRNMVYLNIILIVLIVPLIPMALKLQRQSWAASCNEPAAQSKNYVVDTDKPLEYDTENAFLTNSTKNKGTYGAT